MNESVKEGMYIVNTTCYKCEKTMNVAIIKRGNDIFGPEAFSGEEKRVAGNNGVIIRDQYSGTRQEHYDANTCPHCNTFIGQYYLFADYFTSALYGECEYKIVDIK